MYDFPPKPLLGARVGPVDGGGAFQLDSGRVTAVTESNLMDKTRK